MNAALHRREWLKRSGLALAGFSLSGHLWGQEQPSIGEWQSDAANNIVRIGQNENPYGPGPKAKKAMMEAIGSSNRYPSELATQLREAIATQYGLTKEHVLLGAGSSELLGNTAALAAQENGSNVVSADPTFRLWFGMANLLGLHIKKVPLTADKVHNLPAMLAAMDKNTRMVYVVNPHNPTGTVVADDALKQFAETVTKQCLLLLDEAYTEYSEAQTLAPMVANHKNLVIAKTFSKIHGMAGARVGFVLAHPDTIKQLSTWQPWANAGPSAVSLAGATAALTDQQFIDYTRNNNDKVKAMVSAELNKLGLKVIPSHTSFLYYDSSVVKTNLAEAMTAANIHGIRTYEEGTSWRRTSIGTMSEMQQFVAVLKKLV